MVKPHREFFSTHDLPWRSVSSTVEGLSEAILAEDEEGGTATRLLRFAPGTDTSSMGPQIHDFSEEVFIIDGDLHDLTLGETFTHGMYACRPPGVEHGPWVSPTGCVALEVRYR